MRDNFYVALYPQRFMEGAECLSPTDRAWYALILITLASRGGYIPSDKLPFLIMWPGKPAEFASLLGRLRARGKLFILSDGRVYSPSMCKAIWEAECSIEAAHARTRPATLARKGQRDVQRNDQRDDVRNVQQEKRREEEPHKGVPNSPSQKHHVFPVLADGSPDWGAKDHATSHGIFRDGDTFSFGDSP